MIKNKLRVLVVDDTVVYRKIVSDVLSELPDVEVVGVAHNGKIAMSKIKTLKPDLLTLDIEMPEVNGLEVLKYLQESAPGTGAVMLSTLTSKGGEMTMRALELGAFDFIPKPQSGTMADNKKAVKDALEPMVKAFADRKSVKNILSGVAKKGVARVGVSTVKRSAVGVGKRRQKSEIIGIGISTGGPNALAAMMPGIPSNIGAPILIVQHMPPVFTQSLAKSLNSRCAIEVREAVNGEPLTPNTALIAPGGKQMKIVAGADGKRRVIKITDDPPENSCKPSVDYLFRSIAHHYVGRATGVIMTGMGSDGTTGLKLMKRNGATIIAQDEASCVVYGMPKAPAEAGIVDTIVPLDKIAAAITGTVQNR
ncbi:two-component system, chemotaxis family, protein-glutamate methylesterase/glutaminase [Desulfosarcina sp. BuS5]|uniref:protein-glutamate methylesterase/protein-glutamine glutaminase n=1 Tax=Desulfosarcina sp. BuS5 TaxID=933262 RepID=UPI000552C7F7|nr:chemotaxis response regulator protein-glutamate methylesterase [Desulfosarcina sp. BuS5]WDN88161.1 two-component system, chemotaxis family, protein-glutamate methylesterase/glutaminase [Desulfosarcina sp. BuS5]